MSVRYFGAVGYVLLFTVLYYLLMAASAATAMAIGVHPSGLNVLILIVSATCVAMELGFAAMLSEWPIPNRRS
jgi:hypothetical protein